MRKGLYTSINSITPLKALNRFIFGVQFETLLLFLETCIDSLYCSICETPINEFGEQIPVLQMLRVKMVRLFMVCFPCLMFLFSHNYPLLKFFHRKIFFSISYSQQLLIPRLHSKGSGNSSAYIYEQAHAHWYTLYFVNNVQCSYTFYFRFSTLLLVLGEVRCQVCLMK